MFKKLIEILRITEITKFDEANRILDIDISNNTKSNTAKAIEHYILNLQNKNLKISFTPLSTTCLKYTLCENKGGQAFNLIRSAKVIIDNAILSNPDLQNEIPYEVIQLFDLLPKLDSSQGVVYAIKLPDNLIGIHAEDWNKAVYSSNSLSVSYIIGKILIPIEFSELTLDIKVLDEKLSRKYFYGIGQILNREK
ncbi:MAG: hypothetical protein ACOYMA_17265 [Bacteroidia bacterium]